MNLADALVTIGGLGILTAYFCGYLVFVEDVKNLKKPAIIVLALSLVTVLFGAALKDYHMAHQIVKEIK